MTAVNQEASKESSSGESFRLFSSMRELITLLGAATGLFAALFYLAGRSYAMGYYGAMNIPEYLVTLSIQEYASLAWLPVFLYPAIMIALGGFIWSALYFFRDLLSSTILRIEEWFKKIGKKLFSRLHLPIITLSQDTRLMFALFQVGIFFLISIMMVASTLSFVEQIGLINGKDILLERSLQVELITDKPALSETGTRVTISEGTYYVYKDFRLLQVNNGKYYLFKEIDPTTCRPKRVYVVDADLFKQVNLSPGISLKNICQ